MNFNTTIAEFPKEVKLLIGAFLIVLSVGYFTGFRFVNETTENIGARRLHTVLERLMEEISFNATDHSGEKLTVDAAYVDEHVGQLSQDEDLSRFIL